MTQKTNLVETVRLEAATVADDAPPRPWLALTILLVASFMGILDVFIIKRSGAECSGPAARLLRRFDGAESGRSDYSAGSAGIRCGDHAGPGASDDPDHLPGSLLVWNPLALGWRSIFLVNLPLCVTASIGIRATVGSMRGATRPGLDVVGVMRLRRWFPR